jgi:hypothetical protein
MMEKGETRKGRWYPVTRAGRRLFWVILATILLLLCIVIVIILTLHNRKAHIEGHPLSAKKGGVKAGASGGIAVFGDKSTDHFVLTVNRSSYVTRLDPIISPGKVSSHVHRIHGSAYFSPNLMSAGNAQRLANCSTTVVQDDKSSYWTPQLYHRFMNGSLAAVPVAQHSLYYFQKAPIGETIYPFPDNYNMLAGDPFRRVVNVSEA